MASDLIYFLLAGLGVGALYGLMGTGIVVAYRGSGVINIAHGALAMYSVFQFTELRRNSTFVLPWIDILPGDLNMPVRIQVGSGQMAFTPAIVGTIGMAVLIGFLLHVVFKPLRKASPLGRVIASIGVLLYLQAVALVHFGGSGRQLEPVFPGEPWNNFLGLGRAFPQRNVWAACAAVLIALTLWAYYRYTRPGLATRAAASNEKGAVLLGYSPHRLAAANWIIASVVAAVGGLVVGPIVGTVDPSRYTLFIVAALGAALIGRLQSVVLATFGGLALGMAETGTQFLSSESWFPAWLGRGADSAIPLLVVAGVLFLRGRSLPIRGTLEERRLPPSPQPVRVTAHALVWSAVAVIAAATFTGPWALAFTTSIILMILMLSYVVLTGYIGQISLAQLALAGTAAFALARFMSGRGGPGVSGLGLPMIAAVPLAVAVAVVVGLVVGMPALRIRGVQLAVVTLAAAVFLEGAYFRNPSLTGVSLSDGVRIPKPEFFGMDLGVRSGSGLSDSMSFSLFAIFVLVISALAVTNLRRSSTGRRFLAVRANEAAAAAAGINVARTKMLAFGISSALAGLAGCMLAFQATSISDANWVVLAGMAFLAFAYLGGISSVNGAIVGGLIATGGLVPHLFEFHFDEVGGEYFMILGGVGLVLTSIIHPEGIASTFQPLMRAFGNALLHWRGAEWRAAARRLGPPIALGAIAGWLLWTRQDQYNAWMTALGSALVIFIRAIGLRILDATRRSRSRSASAVPEESAGSVLGASGSSIAPTGEQVLARSNEP